jgi:hypothetical protein
MEGSKQTMKRAKGKEASWIGERGQKKELRRGE